jgi:uncharacterized protein (TIGR00725 family)
MRKLVIAVIGASDPTPEQLGDAEKVGHLLAKEGAVVLNGGLGGVMEAASRGAKQEGGLVVGIVPQDEANEYVDVAIKTGMGEARNALIVNTADAFIAVGGGYGTLSEIAFALKHGKLVAGLGTWGIPGVRKAENPEDAVQSALRAR